MKPLPEKFIQAQQEHLALAQYYRWYQVYEVPFTKARIDNQRDILANDVEIVSMNVVTKGKNGLEDRLKIYDGWKNAHHVKNTQVMRNTDGTLLLEADILYQNIRPDSSRYSYTIHYTTVLQTRENDLPVFTSINIAPTGTIDPPAFEPAYAENRATSFMHYWLYLMETAGANTPAFKELLAENFELKLSADLIITSLDAFKTWNASVPQRVKAAAHTYKNLSVAENNDGTLQVSVGFDWQGLSPDNKPMTAETRHEWILENNPDERFARMKKMTVTQVQPFTVTA